MTKLLFPLLGKKSDPSSSAPEKQDKKKQQQIYGHK